MRTTWQCDEHPLWYCSVPRKRVPGGQCWLRVLMRRGVDATITLEAALGEVLWLRHGPKSVLCVTVLRVEGTARRLNLLVQDMLPS